MKAKLVAALANYDRLSLRERVLVAVASVAAVAFMLHLALVGPAETRRDSLARLATQLETDANTVAGQLAALDARTREPDAALKERLGELRRDLARQDEKLKAVEARLVAPQEVPALLQSLLRQRPGLKLVAMRTLAPEPVGAGEAANTGSGVSQTALPAAPAPVYRHGVELTVQGSYTELLNYLTDLERLPQRMLWQDLRFQVEDHPRITLVLTLTTLSLERAWLQI